MKIKTLTMIVIGVFIAGLIGYDFYAYFSAGQDATVSNVMIEWGHEYPLIPFLMGVIFGHFYWQLAKKKELTK